MMSLMEVWASFDQYYDYNYEQQFHIIPVARLQPVVIEATGRRSSILWLSGCIIKQDNNYLSL